MDCKAIDSYYNINMLTAKMKYRLIMKKSKDKPDFINSAESNYKIPFLNNFFELFKNDLEEFPEESISFTNSTKLNPPSPRSVADNMNNFSYKLNGKFCIMKYPEIDNKYVTF